MEKFADPHLIGSLSGSDKLVGSLITTLMGMGTTFVVLLLIWGIIVVMSKIIGAAEGKSKVQKQPEAAAVTTSVKTCDETPSKATAVNHKKEGQEISKEVVVAITAAIAAFEGSGFKNNLVVRKINRVSGQSPAWRTAGEADCIDSRRI